MFFFPQELNDSNKLAQKEYKTNHDWVGKVVYCEFYKRLKFYHAEKWYIYKAESVLLNETHKILWDFDA